MSAKCPAQIPKRDLFNLTIGYWYTEYLRYSLSGQGTAIILKRTATL